MSHIRVTLRDIAQQTGVSVATVSYALRNSAEVSPKLREKLKKIARKMGYKPDPALTALADYRRKRYPFKGFRENIAFLYQQRNDEITFKDWIKWPIRNDLVSGMKNRAEELGYGLELHEIGTTPSQYKQVSHILKSRGVRAILIHSNMVSTEEIAPYFENFAILNVIQFSESPKFHSIRSNDFEAMRLALDHVYTLGYRHPLFLSPNPTFGQFGPEKLGAFEWFMDQYHDTSCFYIDEIAFKSKCKTLFERASRFDVILTHNHVTLEEIMKENKWKIPRDFGVCHLFASPHIPDYAGIDMQPVLIGKKAIELADMMLRHNEIGPIDCPTSLLVHPIWKNGRSLPPKSTSRKNRSN